MLFLVLVTLLLLHLLLQHHCHRDDVLKLGDGQGLASEGSWFKAKDMDFQKLGPRGFRTWGQGLDPHLQTHTLSFVATPVVTARRAQNSRHRPLFFAAQASM